MLDGPSILSVVKALVSKDKFEQARELLDFFAEHANTIEDYDALGAASIKAQHRHLRLKCAIYLYTRTSTSNTLFTARENLYKTYIAINYPELALFYIELNLKIKPDHVPTLIQQAAAYSLMNCKEKTYDIVKTINSTDPEILKDIKILIASKHLAEGRTIRGINDSVSLDKLKNRLFEEQLKLKLWDGGIFPGKTLIINCEGGIGDEILNLRFVDIIKQMGMRVILYASWASYRPDLVALFQRHGHNVVTNSLFFTKDHLWTHMMNIPVYLGCSEQDLWTGPYLTPLRQEKNKLTDSRLKIGIKCSGSAMFEQDIYRTIDIDAMISALPSDAAIYFFDKDKTHPGVISLKDRLNTWEDTLDLVDQMDVIVSSCTSIVHAAGAMGKSTIVLSPIASYYPWISTRTDDRTVWYGENFYNFKQVTPRSWAEPLQQVTAYFDNKRYLD